MTVYTEARHEALLDTGAARHGFDRDWLGQVVPWRWTDEAGRDWYSFTIRQDRGRGHLPAGRHVHGEHVGAYDPKLPLTCEACNSAVS